MAEGYILETAHWLCEAEANGGGWGIDAFADSSHDPIAGEVAYALSQLAAQDERVREKLAETKDFFSRRLDDSPVPRSVVHLCWIVLGSLACGIQMEDERIAALLTQLETAHRDGWAWSLNPHDDAPRAIYPTYLALLVLSEAREAGRPAQVQFQEAGIWLIGQRSDDQLWSDPDEAPRERRVLESAYAILGLFYALSNDQFEAQVGQSLSVLSDAALELPSEEAVYVEKPEASPELPEWHHCVIPQVAWTRLRILGPNGTLDGTPLPELLTKCVEDMWRDDGGWRDPSRGLSAPYLAADVLRVMAEYSRVVQMRCRIPELAIEMDLAASRAKELAVELGECKDGQLLVRGYPFESPHLALSTPSYWITVASLAAVFPMLAFLAGASPQKSARLALLIIGVFAYVPLRRKLGLDSSAEKFLLIVSLVTILGAAMTVGIGLVE